MIGKVVIGCELDTKSFEKQINQVQAKVDDLEATLQMASEDKTLFSTSEIKDMETELEKAKNKLIQLQKKQNETNKTGFEKISANLSGINKGLTKTISKVSKWALALIGVRSAYALVRKAISLVSSSNEGISSQIDIMKNTIANALVPVVQSVLNLFAKLMVYVDYIFQKLTGRALFDFDKAFADANKNAKATSKSVDKMSKTLAGFDEMNVLSDTSSSSGSTGTTATTITNPFENWQNIQIPEWVNKLVEFGEWVLENWLEVIGQLSLIKLVIDIITGNWIGVIVDFVVFIISQIPRLIEALKTIWDSIKLFGTWLLEKMQELGAKATEWLGNLISKIGEKLSGLWSGLKSGAKNAWEGVKSIFGSVAKFFGDIFGNAWKKVKDVFSTGGKVFTGLKEGIVDAFKKIVNTLIDGINKVVAVPFNALNSALTKLKNVEILKVKPFKWISTVSVPQIPKLAKGGIVNMPGAGIPIGGAIAGERGQEGVIPLTDSQQMQLLGEAIGKYITINANITNSMNGRIISRELQKIQNANGFANNM